MPIYAPEYVKRATANGESLLSLCSGTGIDLQEADVGNLTAVDIFPQYLEELKKVYPHAKTICSDALEYIKKQPDNSVDVISILDGIEHLTKSKGLQLIENMKRVCRKKTLLFTPEGYVRNEPHNVWGIEGADVYQTHKSAWQVKELEGLGFKLVDRQADISQHGEPYFALMLIYEK